MYFRCFVMRLMVTNFKSQDVQLFNAWCPLKGHTYLRKPGSESLRTPGAKGIMINKEYRIQSQQNWNQSKILCI